MKKKRKKIDWSNPESWKKLADYIKEQLGEKESPDIVSIITIDNKIINKIDKIKGEENG